MKIIFSKLSVLIFLFAVSLILIGASKVGAQEVSENLVKNYDVQFPISQLGGCTDYGECRSFCEDPLNAVACVQFAKQKGFYIEDPIVTKKEVVVGQAKKTLGCANESECKAFCEVPANYQKCESFARSNNLIGGRVILSPEKVLLEKAKQSLGCDSPQSCATYCSGADNYSKCSEFAKSVGLRGGEIRRGPGGCTSEETCKSFCSDPVNYSECSRNGGGSEVFRGPGGCTSEEACRSYCEQNPASCKVISIDPYGGPGIIDNPQKAAEEFKKYCQSSPERCESVAQSGNLFSNKDARLEFEKFCSANPESCGAKTYSRQTDGDRRTEYERICKEKPGDCGVGPGGYLIPGWKSGSGEEYADPREYCKKYPDRCPDEKRYADRYQPNTYYDPVQTCNQTQTCKWENGSCRCGEYNPASRPAGSSQSCTSPTSGCGINSYWDQGACSCRAAFNSTSYSSTNSMGRDQQEATCRAGNGSCDWSSGTCNCRGYQSPQSGSAGFNSGSGYTTPSRSQQEEACRAGGGTCTGWYNGACSCERNNSATTNNNNYTYTAPTGTAVDSGISRESQEAACRAGGGTCTGWYNGACSCINNNSGSTGSTTSQPAPTQPPTQPSTQPSTDQPSSNTPSMDPATACAQTSGCSWNGSACQCGSTQGINTSRGLLQILVDFLQPKP
ncbi:hypothetical protein A3C32_03105 [Candidatus Daviesbacteria bacterium RIFCSPHIGHO2_02_FULL_41_14]|uniref:Uncharacterized protein n=1 Tax=Candidatus Daviesbacteria bacterium RIFCSPLOWO2_01_FULL_40_24 TaxID=1797787 RepID=A0A1F5MIW2_9BACT|nr:MAG: hypothetical protein A2780_03665 [Candidatus Daviesbacteria bacterium RIFCSPHIGHO2_01_FULL_41_45]OGE35567.1 MAG: hypothetical protein A3C32_03105 [Candidatus Daviesbacteria bacterium RIFCSPHIGHO2_02_FULL_41_14]OGE65316.1 MAG: hypothetical protein A3B49_00440 [Candidatus Daviesbacteria bacterium RIFCSPLOWO2_01_FULL_40_24]